MPRSLAALAGTGVLALTGCGADDEGTDTSSSEGDATSPPAFIEEADGVCEAGGTAPIPLQGASRQEAIDATVEEIEFREEGLAELGELEPPDELAASFDEYLAKTGEATDILELSLTAAEEGDRERFLELQAQVEGVFIERQRIADTIGFEVCGQLPTNG